MIILDTPRLKVRDYKLSDLDEMHRLWSDVETMYYLDDIYTTSIEGTRKFLQNGMTNSDGHYFCICEKGSDDFIGGIGYTITARTPLGNVVHLGYMLLPEYHRRGYMPEAVKTVIEFAFTQDDCIRMTSGCHTENIASSKVLDRAGFRKEGECIKAVYHDGVMKDRLEYAINKDEFLV